MNQVQDLALEGVQNAIYCAGSLGIICSSSSLALGRMIRARIHLRCEWKRARDTPSPIIVGYGVERVKCW